MCRSSFTAELPMSAGNCRGVAMNSSSRARWGPRSISATAQRAAAVCAELCLAALAEAVGGLDRVEQIFPITGYVASAPGFVQQSQVMNGASEVFVAHLGSRGRHARTSVGVAELPRGAPVEIDIVAATDRVMISRDFLLIHLSTGGAGALCISTPRVPV